MAESVKEVSTTPIERWTVNHSTELYGVNYWGGQYFSVSPDGHLQVRLGHSKDAPVVSLREIVDELNVRGLSLPVLLRFGDILDSRISLLNEHFRNAISEVGYHGVYRGVYPVKVNQQQQVIEEIARFGKRFHHGFEAGSKAELIAALAYIDDPEALVICNGYKDREFIDQALYGLKLGVRTVLVVEMPGELDLIIERAKSLGIRPVIGVRVRLSSRAGGHWNESGGDRSVFGLTTTQIISLVDQLREEGMLDCLQLLHYHLGSQIPNIRDIRDGISEAVCFYVGLVREGASMGILDIGGGLAVDYDGSHTNFPSSSNYSVSEYCADIVEAVMSACDEANVEHPTLVSESGRATVAYYSVLLFNVLDVGRFVCEDPSLPETPENSEILGDILSVRKSLTPKNAQECFHDLLFYRDDIRARFLHGTVSLRERAQGEQLFWAVLDDICRIQKGRKYVPEELQGLEETLTDIYYGNFSVFQSLPDAWAIEQLFPVMPIHRLEEKPTSRAILSDITCDCDGRIDRFIDLHDVRRSLPVHPLRPGEDYILGIFLVGAYQETLGDLHNLLGDTNVVSIRAGDNGEIELTREISGDTVADVLSYVEYDPKELIERMRRKAEKAVQSGAMNALDRRYIMNAYRQIMDGYTYYKTHDPQETVTG